MTYNVDRMFKHMNLQAIRNLLIDGNDEYAFDSRPFSVRLKTGSDPIFKRIESLYPDSKERDEAVADLCRALNNYEAVFMELGIKAGARLICELLITDDQVPERRQR